MKRNIYNILWACGVGATLMMQSCSLEEVNPGEFSLEVLGSTPQGYEKLLNQCYFGLERQFYNGIDFMGFMEGNTDLWTSKTNQPGVNDNMFKFFANASPNLTFTGSIWNAAYDGIGACNMAIEAGAGCSFSTEEQRNAKVAEARFLRAVYYYNLVEMFGGVVKLTEVQKENNYSPVRTEPLEIYRDIIIPDLDFAAKWLPKGDDSFDGHPARKAALGYLAKACLATRQYDTTDFLQIGFDAAKKLISDCEAGGSAYNAYMYPDFEDVFAEVNNKANKEALWKYSVYAGSDAHGSSNGNYRTNRNDEHFLCQLNHFGARKDNQESRKAWDGGVQGDFMPTQHLLSLYIQQDGSLDPRFHNLFITEWKANQAYSWTEGDV
ncbi:RagB/SusD family nutrient uptake outer membrane protein, partial [uncultured Duncaniella sp.]